METLTYNEAFARLEKLVHEVEDKDIQLDTLADKIKQARELIILCERKLRRIHDDMNQGASI